MKKTLSTEYETCIKKHLLAKLEKDNLREKFPNPLLREDVFSILGLYCKVVFFPLNDTNDGFHIDAMPFASGEEQPFVFINTSRSQIEQVFTAAHELGHIWKIDDLVINEIAADASKDVREDIVGRFAAILLMPEELFLPAYTTEFDKLKEANGKITILNMLKVIVSLMIQFYTPMESVVYRLKELGKLELEAVELLLGKKDIERTEIDETIAKLLNDLGQFDLQKKSNKRWIDGLAELLDTAEKEDLFPEDKIEKIRDKFKLKDAEITEDMNDFVPTSD